MPKLLEQLRSFLRPEFINRIDDIVVFNSLDAKLIRQIVEIQLRDLNKLLKDRKLTINLNDAAKDFLGERGYDAAFGARPLKRAIYKYVQVPLSKKILAGDFIEGDKISVDVGKGAAGDKELVMKSEPSA
jgi:ATP-dependent Clp protease ATP-binding subunit ClpB